MKRANTHKGLLFKNGAGQNYDDLPPFDNESSGSEDDSDSESSQISEASDDDSVDRPNIPTMNIAGVESPSSDDGSDASEFEEPDNTGVYDENAGVHLEVENKDIEIKPDENTGVQNEPVETNENVDNTGVHDELAEAETTAPDTDTNAPARPTDDIENESD